MDITESNNLVEFTIEDNCYINGKFIGTTVAKKITVNILNPNNSINLENKTIQVYTGIKIGETTEEIPLGTFIIEKPDSEETEEKTSFVGYDYMIKFNKEYVDNNTYPISLKEYLTNLCSQVGLELGSTKLVNENYQILGNPFTNHEDCKTVLSKIAELCGGFAKVGRDNKLYIINLNSTEYTKGLTVDEVHRMKVSEINSTLVKYFSKTQGIPSSATIDGNTYMKFKKNNMYGEVNSLVLRLSQVEGENDTETDEASITANGLTEIAIEDNPFLINSEERKKVIKELWKALKGLKYLPFKLEEYYGFPYLDTGDKIEILDTEDTEYTSFVFEHKFTYNGAFKGLLNTEALTKIETQYKNLSSMKTKFRKVELAVDKINGKITTVIEAQDEQETKINQTIQDVNGTTIEIKNIKTDLQNNYDTSTEVSTKINAKAGELNVEIAKKVNNADFTSAQILLRINNDTSEAKIKADKISLDGKEINLTAGNTTIKSTNFSVDKNGKVTCSDITATGGKIGGFTLGTTQFSVNINGIYNYNIFDARMIIASLLGYISNDNNLFDVNEDGQVNIKDSQKIVQVTQGTGSFTKKISGTFQINSTDPKNCITVKRNGSLAVSIGTGGVNSKFISAENIVCGTQSTATNSFFGVTINGQEGTVYAESYNNLSLESIKKNINKFDNALSIIENSEIYEYNFKTEKDTEKKHVGFVIGDKYNTPNIVKSNNGKAIESYTMSAITWKAIQELSQRLKILEEK
ncbi:MAG: tail fiber domain-containing protein [Clostridia bacterium]|nr:tail fiber domain-containing protein [Clostridia bacterium]